MNKEELIKKLEDIEWEDFEVKEAKSEIPKNSTCLLHTEKIVKRQTRLF
ncbi:hypothetical protein C5S53_01125 [Methanophagales archaeon]|nr:hypothetical protein C5S53_01125 [Methanophagales archaeon]